jgi:hypothetical protein
VPQSTEMCIFDFLRFWFLGLQDPICQGSPGKDYEATKDLDWPSHAQRNSFWSYPPGLFWWKY